MRLSPRLLVCMALVLLVATTAHAQAVVLNPPSTSGALLTIKDSGGNTIVNIYDSQIHSGNAQTSPCDPAGFATDAYVLQGGSPTGCAPSDTYEITDVATSTTTFAPRSNNNPHQQSGATDISGFHIETHFVCVGKCAMGVTGTKTFCNTLGTICITVLNGNPADNGFVVVTNTTGSATGKIVLQGSSAGCVNASDSVTSLASGASVILAMGKAGTVNPDSSHCGGFNADQILPISLGTTTTFLFGKEQVQIAPTTAVNPVDEIAFRPEPVPQAVFQVDPSSPFGITNGVSQTCVSIGDFSAPGNPVCPELQFVCLDSTAQIAHPGQKCPDNEQFFQKSVFSGHLDPNDPLESGGIGAVHFLGATDKPCTQTSFDSDSVLSYTGDSPSDLPLSSGGKLNCFVATFVPSATPVPAGVTVKAFDGFFSPVQPLPTVNPLNGGQNAGLPFFFGDGAGGPGVLGLNWCPGGPSALPNTSVCVTPGVQEPWVAFLRTPISVPGCTGASSASGFIGNSPTNSFMQNLGAGQNKFNWATDRSEPTTNNCFSIGVVFSNGLSVPVVGDFAFTK